MEMCQLVNMVHSEIRLCYISYLRRSPSRAGKENTEERNHHHITVLKQQKGPERNHLSLGQMLDKQQNKNNETRLFSIQPKDIPEWSTESQPKETQQGNDTAHDSMLEYFYPLKLEVRQMKSGCHVQNRST